MRRTLILTALGATTLSIGLGVGATLASAHPAPPGPTVNAMHTTMHAAMSNLRSADQLAACDSAHASMTNGQPPNVASMPNAGHNAHHQGTLP